MGIINTNNESFYSNSRYIDPLVAANKALEMVEDGADIIDIGGCSTRPGSTPISIKEEIDNLIPTIKKIKAIFDSTKQYDSYRYLISIDTFRSEVVRAVYDIIGEFIVNDISAGEDDSQMLSIIAKLNLPYIAMHKRGDPSNMQQYINYPKGVVNEVKDYFLSFKNKCEEIGIKEWYLDPGLGFAKTLDQNYQLLNHLDNFEGLSSGILIGLSRKSMIYKLLNTTPEESLNATSALNLYAMIKGASILRVHDVKEGIQIRKLYYKLKENI